MGDLWGNGILCKEIRGFPLRFFGKIGVAPSEFNNAGTTAFIEKLLELAAPEIALGKDRIEL